MAYGVVMASKKTNTKTGVKGRVVDLDAMRAARAEVEQEPVVIRFGGEEFTLPPEMPVGLPVYAQSGDLEGVLATLFGDEARRFMSRASVQDVHDLVDGVLEVYGLTEGESDASPNA